jgi:nucleoside 2-deoxyribosyltransferase
VPRRAKSGRIIERNKAMGKSCYIIGPIGKPDSEERKWADFVKDHIVTPVVQNLGYQLPQRSDKDHSEAMIMTGIVQQMFEADLVIADLTDRNPNVFYELGIRNCAHKPVIHLIKEGQSPPFDLAGNRAIFISRDHEIVLKAQAEIAERVEAIEKKPGQFYSHVQTYMQSKELDALKTGGGKAESQIADALSLLLNMVESNTNMLVQLCGATVGKPKKPLSLSYLDMLNLRDHANVEIKNKLKSLTTTEPLDFDT